MGHLPTPAHHNQAEGQGCSGRACVCCPHDQRQDAHAPSVSGRRRRASHRGFCKTAEPSVRQPDSHPPLLSQPHPAPAKASGAPPRARPALRGRGQARGPHHLGLPPDTHFLYSKKCSAAWLSHTIWGRWSFSVWMYLGEAGCGCGGPPLPTRAPGQGGGGLCHHRRGEATRGQQDAGCHPIPRWSAKCLQHTGPGGRATRVAQTRRKVRKQDHGMGSGTLGPELQQPGPHWG